jgi:hypothetical protein
MHFSCFASIPASQELRGRLRRSRSANQQKAGAHVRHLTAERTLWEKLTLLHNVASRGGQAVLEEIWDANPLLRQYLGRIDNPEPIVYCIRATRVRYVKEC